MRFDTRRPVGTNPKGVLGEDRMVEHDREQAIGHMLEQIMDAVDANLRAVTAELRAFDFAARAIGETHIKAIVQAHGSALQEARLVTEALEHWGTILQRGESRPGDLDQGIQDSPM